MTDEPRTTLDPELERRMNAAVGALIVALARAGARADHKREMAGLPPLYAGESEDLAELTSMVDDTL